LKVFGDRGNSSDQALEIRQTTSRKADAQGSGQTNVRESQALRQSEIRQTTARMADARGSGQTNV